MLARGVVTRPVTTTIRRLGGQRRFTLPSTSTTSRSQALPRPNPLLSKIRFRADGKPRSKLIALGFGSLISLNLLLLYTLYDMIDGAEEIKKHLAKIIYVQRTDTTYDSVDFDDPMSVIEYFAKLYHPLYLQDSEEEINQIIAGLMLQIFRKDTKDGSKKSGIQALLIMRSAAMKVHNAFQELDSNQVKDIADLVMLAMVEALESIKNLANDDDESSPI